MRQFHRVMTNCTFYSSPESPATVQDVLYCFDVYTTVSKSQNEVLSENGWDPIGQRPVRNVTLQLQPFCLAATIRPFCLGFLDSSSSLCRLESRSF